MCICGGYLKDFMKITFFDLEVDENCISSYVNYEKKKNVMDEIFTEIIGKRFGLSITISK
ncbi:hypothetical protein M2277_004990 [Paenibacillus sp. LBL]|nr:hypothetical protein [Paenibacillus sp. LBL]